MGAAFEPLTANQIQSVFRRTQRGSRSDVFECSSSYSANCLRTCKVRSVSQGLFKNTFKDPLPPLASDKRLLLVRGGFAHFPWFAVVSSENNFFERLASIYTRLYSVLGHHDLFWTTVAWW
ncbi:hypothetical protein AVEN_39103-1 [Araneus ventricosus]|uniref:Uncharacterized protein n=1 Tax=Araneus ventricosus TaxID=182803 RepID=A0A4Y2DG26_ARAVE|nr:hypothetical protein AVEN_39103-1 [Araneus ventricosus]